MDLVSCLNAFITHEMKIFKFKAPCHVKKHNQALIPEHKWLNKHILK